MRQYRVFVVLCSIIIICLIAFSSCTLHDSETPPAPADKATETKLPDACIRYNNKILVCYGTPIVHPTEQWFASHTEVGTVLGSVNKRQYPTEDFYTNCGYVGDRVFASGDEVFILHEDGSYTSFGPRVTAGPSRVE